MIIPMSIDFLSIYETERVGFEPTDAFTSLVFKTRAINHSTTFPSGLQSSTYEPCVVSFVPAIEYLLSTELLSYETDESLT